MVGIGLLAIIGVPYMYYSVQINIFAHRHKPEGHFFPEYADLVYVVVTGLACHLY